MKDIFEIQEQIAQAIVTTMRLSLDKENLTRPKTQSSEAYDLYLKGNRFFNKPDKQNIFYARQLFKQAVAIDPDYGLAWAKLASTYSYEYLCSNSNKGNREKAREISLKALELAPELLEPHLAMGTALAICREYHAADLEFETAIELKPNSFGAVFIFARAKYYRGDIPEAIELYQQAAEIRPEDYQSVLLQVPLLRHLGDIEGSKKKAKEGLLRAVAFLKVNPDDNRAWNMGAFALQALGRLAEAKAWLRNSLRNSPRGSIITYNAACFYALIGDTDKSLDYLAESAETGLVNLGWLERDADLDRIRDEPRFKQIIARFDGKPTNEIIARNESKELALTSGCFLDKAGN